MQFVAIPHPGLGILWKLGLQAAQLPGWSHSSGSIGRSCPNKESTSVQIAPHDDLKGMGNDHCGE